MKQSIGINLQQKQTLTPALRQAMQMLNLSAVDLRTQVQEALESNLMLEDGENTFEADNPTSTQQDEYTAVLEQGADIPDNLPLDANWDDIYAGSSTTSKSSTGPHDGEDFREYDQANLTGTPDLYAHLTWQADVHPFTQTQRAIADVIIDAINPSGLLADWDEIRTNLVNDFGVPAAEVDAGLAAIQNFDPPGVAARSLDECLAVQLLSLPETLPGRALALAIVEARALEQLAAGERDALAQRFATSTAELDTAQQLIRSLNPSPGDAFSPQEVTYVVPEILVTRGADGWQVMLNPDLMPKVRLNDRYMALIRRADNSSDQSTLKAHLQEARFFLYSLRSRNETLLEVARCIVKTQRAFLEYGEEAMKPLVLRDVAAQLDVHESTVSRATANKYMQTPRGIFELKYFFSSHVATIDGGVVSATAIQAMIKRMVAAEPVAKPLSDSLLAQKLVDNGVQVARRTVAKYRELMLIPSSRERRKKSN